MIILRVSLSLFLIQVVAVAVSDADPIYVDVPDIAIDGTHELDLNMDGSVDFRIIYGEMVVGSYPDEIRASLNLLVNDRNAFLSDSVNDAVAALENQVEVGPSGTFKTTLGSMAVYVAPDASHGALYGGNWSGVKDHFLGLRFKINDADHFAWVRLDVSWVSKGVLKDWAYESDPGTALTTGAGIPTPTDPTTWGRIKARYRN